MCIYKKNIYISEIHKIRYFKNLFHSLPDSSESIFNSEFIDICIFYAKYHLLCQSQV